MMKKHFVTFYSPGTFISERTTKSVDSWDVSLALQMAGEIKERHNAVPYGFKFSTRERSEDDLDSQVTETSPMYYLGGEIFTLEQVKARNDPQDEILIQNMECNGWNRFIVNTNSWKWTAPLRENDVVLEWEKESEDV